MLKRMLVLILAVFVAVNLCGCIACMAMLAESAKAKQTLKVPYSEAIDIVKGALRTMNLRFQDAVIRQDIAEVRGQYTDDRTARIYIYKQSENESLIAVRVGVTEAGKKDAEVILRAIVDYADLMAKR